MTFVTIGRYEVRGEIGRGGMATVYHAYDPRFERDVAIKVLPHEFLHDPQFRARFEREAKMIALLEHPAIVPVYDFGEEDGQPYIVMRFMSGGSLADRLKTGALPVDESVQLITRLAPSLDAAHAKGIIHRDLKPGNILFDQYGNAFLSDFGIARLAHSTQVATLTGGAILGTPAYMSPEQIQGDKEIDGRSDIYAFGVILYQILTGVTPYKSDTPAKIMMMHILEPVPNILSANQSLPAGLEMVVRQAMAKEPNDRYATAGEMATAVEAVVKGTGELTRPKLDATVLTPGAQRTVVQGREAGTAMGQPRKTVKETERVADAPPISAPPAVKKKSGGFPIWLGILLGLLVVGVVIAAAAGGTAYILGTAKKPTDTRLAPTSTLPVIAAVTEMTPTSEPPTFTPTLQSTPTPTIQPSDTPLPSPTGTPTPVPTDTSTPVPEIPVIGGADKLALVDGNNNIWVMNVDGSDPAQLTVDNAVKDNLQWSPDGQSIIFISGNCIKMVNVETGRVDDITCFVSGYPNSLKAVEISPDGQQIAISFLGELYLLPYNLETLKTVDRISQLKFNAVCDKIAPYSSANGTAFIVKWVRWSLDMKTLAVDLLGIFDGKQVDQIDIIDIANCDTSVFRVDEFPGTRFVMSGYKDTPWIENFTWNGESLFVLTGGQMRNSSQDGYGDLYLYNSELHHGQKINPLDSACCYRDPTWSPDGSHLVFAFQDIRLGLDNVTQIYIIPYGAIGTGTTFIPLALPENLFSNAKDKPLPALRPAK